MQPSAGVARADEHHQAAGLLAVVGEVVGAERPELGGDRVAHPLEEQVGARREVLVVDQGGTPPSICTSAVQPCAAATWVAMSCIASRARVRSTSRMVRTVPEPTALAGTTLFALPARSWLTMQAMPMTGSTRRAPSCCRDTTIAESARIGVGHRVRVAGVAALTAHGDRELVDARR